MKYILTLTFLFSLNFLTKAQQTVKIEFYGNSTGDYDLMIKRTLNDNGYSAFVNYGTAERTSDFTLKYETTSRENYDELHKYKFTLLDNKGELVNSIEKTISYINFGINEPKEICKGLGKLFNKKFDCKSYTEPEEVKYFNISFNIHKIDSATYSIIAKGAGIRPLEDVQEAFLKKASQYLTSFDYYFESGTYNYSASGGYVSTSHTGFAVAGIIRPPSTQGQKTQLEEKPEIFIEEFDR